MLQELHPDPALFAGFVNQHVPAQVSRHLRHLLLDYIRHHADTGLPADFINWIDEVEDLCELLEVL